MKKTAVKYFALLLGSAAGIYLLFRLRNVVWMLSLSVTAAYLLDRPLRTLRKHTGKIGAIILPAVLFAGAVWGITAILPELTAQFTALFSALPGIVAALEEAVARINTNLDWDLFNLTSLSDKFAESMLNILVRTGKGIGDGLWLLPVPIITFYFIKDRERFLSVLQYMIPVGLRDDFSIVLKRIDFRLRKYLKGQLIVALCVGGATTAGLLLVRAPYALALGITMAVCNMVPYIGPWLGAIPILLTALSGGPSRLFSAAAVVLLTQLMDNYIISPRVIGENTQLHPVAIIVALMAFSILFGPVGLLIAVPGVVAAREVGSYILAVRRQKKKREVCDMETE